METVGNGPSPTVPSRLGLTIHTHSDKESSQFDRVRLGQAFYHGASARAKAMFTEKSLYLQPLQALDS